VQKYKIKFGTNDCLLGGGKPLSVLNFQSIAPQQDQVLMPRRLKSGTLWMASGARVRDGMIPLLDACEGVG
jgi:hypothetical protein